VGGWVGGWVGEQPGVGVIGKVDGDSKYAMGQQSLFPKT